MEINFFFFFSGFIWVFVSEAMNHSLHARVCIPQCMLDAGCVKLDAYTPYVDSSFKGSYHCVSFRRIGDFKLAWFSFRSSFLSLFCLTIVFPDTLKRSAKQIKDNVILPAFFHMADNKTYPFSYRMCISM